MGSNYSGLIVTHYSESSSYVTSTNITTDVLSLPLFTDTGSGEINECEIVLSAKGGKYVNSGTQIKSFDRFRIQLTDLSSNSYDRYFEVTDLIPTQSKIEGSILTIHCLGIEYHTQMINYAKRDWFKSSSTVAKHIGTSYGENKGTKQPTLTAYDSTYSTSTKKGIALPDFTNNHYEFGQSEENHYNRFMDLVDLLGGSAASGGVGDFFDLGFDTSGVNDIEVAVFSSGARSRELTDDSNHITVKNTQSINVSEQEGGISNPTGTNLLAWGSSEHGSLPLGMSKYRGGELEFLFRPVWKSGLVYVNGAKVLHQKKHYESIADDNNQTPGNPSWWTQIDMGDEFGDSEQYSEWTDDKTSAWINCGTKPNSANGTLTTWLTGSTYSIYDLVTLSGVQYRSLKNSNQGNAVTDTDSWEVVDNAHTGGGAGFFDSNLVIKDDDSFRTWVNVAETGGGISTNYFQHTGLRLPLGFRFLNTGTFITGNDPDGKSYANAVVERRYSKATDAPDYFVLYAPDSTTDRMEVMDIGNGILYEWNNALSSWNNIAHTNQTVNTWSSTTTFAKGDFVHVTTREHIKYRSKQNSNLNHAVSDSDWWELVEISKSTQNDDCNHTYFSIQNIKGVDSRPHETDSTKFPEVTKAGGLFTKNINSALEVVYKFGVVDNNPQSASDYRKGAWLNFGFPYPMTSFKGSEGVGDLYGGGTNATDPPRASVLDVENMTWTHDGKQGFNNSSSEDLGTINSMAFHMRVAIQDSGLNNLDGIAQIRCTIYDTSDHVATQDFEIGFSNGITWDSINLPMSGFKIYRGRKPLSYLLRGVSIVDFKLPIPELDINEQFEFRNIKLISFQIQDVYDDNGRYNPEKDMFAVDNFGISTTIGGNMRMAIDSFHFKKTLLASSGSQSVRNLEPKFLQRPNIISYNQLKNDVNTQLEIEQFKHKEFNFQTSGKDVFDMRFGETFFLENDDLISDTDDTTAGQTTKKKIKLVAKRIEYHLTKPIAGTGGLTRSIKGIKRFS
jgi:hypothetical protein